VAQKDEKTEDPKNEDLHSIGTLATILQMLKLPDGTIKVLVEGVKRAKIERLAIIISLKRSTSLTSFNIPSTSSGIFLLSLI
jgi:ATP-dependent Lon protease